MRMQTAPWSCFLKICIRHKVAKYSDNNNGTVIKENSVRSIVVHVYNRFSSLWQRVDISRDNQPVEGDGAGDLWAESLLSLVADAGNAKDADAAEMTLLLCVYRRNETA